MKTREMKAALARAVNGTSSVAKRIPIAEAQRLAETYGYDEVVIVARRNGDAQREHVTTYPGARP